MKPIRKNDRNNSTPFRKSLRNDALSEWFDRDFVSFAVQFWSANTGGETGFNLLTEIRNQGGKPGWKSEETSLTNNIANYDACNNNTQYIKAILLQMHEVRTLTKLKKHHHLGVLWLHLFFSIQGPSGTLKNQNRVGFPSSKKTPFHWWHLLGHPKRQHLYQKNINPRSLTVRPWKVIYLPKRKGLSSNHPFSGAMLNFRWLCFFYPFTFPSSFLFNGVTSTRINSHLHGGLILQHPPRQTQARANDGTWAWKVVVVMVRAVVPA